LTNITSGLVIATAVTGSDGKYAFPGLPPGSYKVTKTSPDGYIDVGKSSVDVNLGPGENAVVNFVSTLPTKPPTRKPTPPYRKPTPFLTAQPTKSLTPAPTVTPTVCKSFTVVDFDTAADGTPTKPGEYVRDQWKSLGFTLFAEGGLSSKMGNMPRIFDTKNPGTEKAGDPDLGAPNVGCTPSGPGIGEGGKPGTQGANCAPQGNVLIIQEANRLPGIPDDNGGGGIISLDFPDTGGKYVSEIGLLDIDEKGTSLVVIYENDKGGTSQKVIPAQNLGNNSFQFVKIDTARVKSIKVMLTGSGAVTGIKFCP
jgi:hypothetical protein